MSKKAIVLGGDVTVDLDVLVNTRLLIQANSGGGKSWCLRRLLEQTHGRIQHLVIDPEGEFSSLRAKFDYVLAAKRDGDTIFDVLIGQYPQTLTKETIAAEAGYEANGGGFNNALSRLRTLELITRGQDIRASEHLFS